MSTRENHKMNRLSAKFAKVSIDADSHAPDYDYEEPYYTLEPTPVRLTPSPPKMHQYVKKQPYTCIDFTRGRCQRGAFCKFLHTAPKYVFGNKRTHEQKKRLNVGPVAPSISPPARNSARIADPRTRPARRPLSRKNIYASLDTSETFTFPLNTPLNKHAAPFVSELKTQKVLQKVDRPKIYIPKKNRENLEYIINSKQQVTHRENTGIDYYRMSK